MAIRMKAIDKGMLLKRIWAAGVVIVASFAVVSCSEQAGETEMKTPESSLKVQLDEKKDSFNAQAPDSVKKTYADGIQAVVELSSRPSSSATGLLILN